MKNNGLPMWWMGEGLFTFSEEQITFLANGMNLWDEAPDPSFWGDESKSWSGWFDSEGVTREWEKSSLSDGWSHIVIVKRDEPMKLYIDGHLWKGKWHERASRLFRFITRRYPDETSWRGT